MNNVVEFTVSPREIVSSIGRHKLITTYRPDEPEDHRWGWKLKVVVTYEYSGSAVTPSMCRVQASHYATLHDQLAQGHSVDDE